MRPMRILLASAVLVALPAAPASPDHGGIHPAFRSESVFFQCTEPTPVYQANWLAAAGDESAYTPWSTSGPPGSVTDGEGCMALDDAETSSAATDAVFRGTFTGNLRDLTVRIYDFVFNNARTTPTQTLRLYAEIDGVPLFPKGDLDGFYDGRTLEVATQDANSGVTDFFEFSITNIGFATPVLDENGNVVDVETGGAALEDSTGTQEHELTLFLGVADEGDVNPHVGITSWVWGTTEVPSGITFNPSTLAPSRVEADLPDLSGS